QAIIEAGLACDAVYKVNQGRPHLVDMIKNNEVQLIVNTTEGKRAIEESRSVRITALRYKVAYFTTIAGGCAAVEAIVHGHEPVVHSLQALQGHIVERAVAGAL